MGDLFRATYDSYLACVAYVRLRTIPTWHASPTYGYVRFLPGSCAPLRGSRAPGATRRLSFVGGGFVTPSGGGTEDTRGAEQHPGCTRHTSGQGRASVAAVQGLGCLAPASPRASDLSRVTLLSERNEI